MSDVNVDASVQPDPVPPAVTDRRPVPRGVLPRGMQTWIMVGVAVGMLAIMLIVGRPDPPPATSSRLPHPCRRRRADRVRDYQDRLRLLEAQALARSADGNRGASGAARQYDNTGAGPSAGPDRRRAEAARIREPLCEQRRAQPASRERTTGSGTRSATMAAGAVRAARLTKSVCRGSR